MFHPCAPRHRSERELRRRRLRQRRQRSGRRRTGRKRRRRRHPAIPSRKKIILMASLQTDFLGIKSPNPFWLASPPPTAKKINFLTTFRTALVGVVWKN